MINFTRIMVLRDCGKLNHVCCLTAQQLVELVAMLRDATDPEIREFYEYVCACSVSPPKPVPDTPGPPRKPPDTPDVPVIPKPPPLPTIPKTPDGAKGWLVKVKEYFCYLATTNSFDLVILGLATLANMIPNQTAKNIALGLLVALKDLQNKCKGNLPVPIGQLTEICKKVNDLLDQKEGLDPVSQAMIDSALHQLLGENYELIISMCKNQHINNLNGGDVV
jgi:hypothetical protein